MYKLVFYVPVTDSELVKSALFAAGAGTIGQYDHCCFESLGVGQFRPLSGANPTLGKVGELERVSELKIEMLCIPDKIHSVVKVLKETHPYEEPAYEVIKLESI
jgi:hypothetical protein